MESFIKSEIFFFIASVSVIIITSILFVSGVYFIKIMINLAKVSRKLKNATDNAEENFSEMGDRVLDSPLFNLLFGKRKKKKDKESNY